MCFPLFPVISSGLSDVLIFRPPACICPSAPLLLRVLHELLKRPCLFYLLGSTSSSLASFLPSYSVCYQSLHPDKLLRRAIRTTAANLDLSTPQCHNLDPGSKTNRFYHIRLVPGIYSLS